MNRDKWWVSLSVFLATIAILAAKIDQDFSYQWLIFWTHTSAIVVLFLAKIGKGKKFLKMEKTGWISLGFVLFLAIISRFIFLKIYPFVSRGDELRDGGLDGRKMFTSEQKDLFGWGRYESHGRIIPTFTSFFYLIFKESVLTYRAAAGLLSVLDIVLVWLISKKLFNKKVAFFSSLILISLPLHLFYARTEVVVIFSSFLTSLVLLNLFNVYEKKRLLDWMSLAMLLGWCFNFHASVRTMVFGLGLISLFLLGWRLVKQSKEKKEWLAKLVLFPIFVLMGFGPRLWQTPAKIFFQQKRSYVTVDHVKNINVKKLDELKQRYLKSLMVWFYEPTTSWFGDHKPILKPVWGFLFIVGLGAMILDKKWQSKILVLLALLIPFTNSAITKELNSDHRLAPMLPIGAMIIGYGFWLIFQRYKHILGGRCLVAFYVIFSLTTMINFYAKRVADEGRDDFDYLSMNLVYMLRSSLPKGDNFCLTSSETNAKKFRLMHYQEQYEYFFPESKIKIWTDDSFDNNEVMVSANCGKREGATQYLVRCDGGFNFTCPLRKRMVFKYYL